MKKSKIIVPALAIITLSTAASITGTVAWFTANRTASVTVGDMAVVKEWYQQLGKSEILLTYHV